MVAPEGSILPLEVLFKIFSYLEVQEIEESVAPVCRLWRDASRLPDLRRRLTLTKDISPSAAHDMLRRSPLLTELKILYCRPSSYTDEPLRTAAAHNVKLRVLTIKGRVSDIGLEAVAQCSQIRSLTLLGDEYASGITDHGLLHLKGLRHLEKLQLNGLKRVTAAGWRRLFSICEWPHLRELSFTLCSKVEDEMPQVQFKRLHTTLRSIELSGSVSFMDLVAVAQCDHLRVLSLNYVHGVTDDGLMLLLRLRHLKKISLHCPNVTPVGWGRLFSMCEWPYLRELRLSLCDADREEGKVTFDRLHRTLRSISLCGGVSDFDLEAVAQCDHLRTLSLNDCINYTSCDITDDGIVHLARLRRLEKLTLWDADSVTPSGWRRLFSMCEWPHLRELSVILYHADTEGWQVTFDRLHTTLRSLELCGDVSDIDLEAVAQCDHLRTLSLNDCINYTSCNITDDGIVHLARLRHLEKLILRNTYRVTAAGWRRLFSMCDWPHLRQLHLSSFEQLEERDRDDLQRQAKLLCPDFAFSSSFTC